MKKNQSLNEITSAILTKLPEIFAECRPDLILVQGDTTTAFAAALASFYAKIPIAHIEAGLRTGNPMMPFPEEMNRKLISSMASFHFAPTEGAKENLLKEKVEEKSITVSGNTVIDALFFTLNAIKERPELKQTPFPFIDRDKKLLLVTGHRRENFGEGFASICRAIQILSQRDDLQIIYPVHLNPNVQKPVQSILGGCKNVHLIEPLDYISFVSLMDLSYLILTDSGGVQEEGPSLGKPVLVMREVTERPEAVIAGTVALVGTNTQTIVEKVSKLLDDPIHYTQMAKAHNPYGDGHATKRIIQHLVGEYAGAV